MLLFGTDIYQLILSKQQMFLSSKTKLEIPVIRNNCVLNGVVQLHVFTISNGVRQGGILSPKIFALYMNGVTDELSNSYPGCYINDECINHIMYADDICLMALTGTAMQNLLNVCLEYGDANDILFNPLKSVCIVYITKYFVPR